MTIYIIKDCAFVDLNKGYLLCIGSKEEVEKADAEQIDRMVREAIATSLFRNITSSQGQKLN